MTREAVIEYSARDGRRLRADLNLPADGCGPCAAVVLVPGGGWRVSDRRHLAHWARWLAAHGIAACCVEYATAKEAPAGAFPQAVQDIWAALRELHAQGPSLGIDPACIGLLGESAGATVAALAALGRSPVLLEGESATPPRVAALVGIYGTYDMRARWRSQLHLNEPPGLSACRAFLGVDPYENPQRYFDASPLAHVSYDSCRGLPVLLAWGGDDPMVPLDTQSEAFAQALREARNPVSTCAVPGAGHFWFQAEPVDEPYSPNAVLAPRLLRFLRTALTH